MSHDPPATRSPERLLTGSAIPGLTPARRPSACHQVLLPNTRALVAPDREVAA
ncbi:hypothetical protein F5X71_13395 [Nocardia brasiliensis]|uniref:Uncharacterized protein n=1 Tax=Nocardia brasiliensis TaxID=37326 RepID=A0A6G9XQI4_NOCBR|nr:hypothetical protein [Nocardia brasiliensis]QIS03174.1 hypothetical protein F5X71_13395 [Nocardia brasiliensis]